jgi:trehalose/maltose hydrolase-like predicted phosphorylase
MRASRPVSRGPTWVSWLGYIRWASWPRCYVAGLFDRPNTVPPVPALVPVADWSRVRLVLDDRPQLLLDGEFLASVRSLDLRRGVLLSDLTYLAHAGITISGGELRLVSLADRAVALQLARFSLDRDGIDVTLEANFAMAGMGMEPLQLDRDVCAWRTEGSGKSVAMAGSATLRADGKPLVPERSFSLRWIWRWRSAGLGDVWQAMVLGFAGLELGGDAISLTPRLPPEWRSMSFAVRWRGRPVQVRIAGDNVRVAIADGDPMQIRIGGQTHNVQGGSALEVSCETQAVVQE